MSSDVATKRSLILLGAGGHAKVLHALVQVAGYTIIGVCDPQLSAQRQPEWRGIPVLGSDEALKQIDPASVGLVNGIGQSVGSRVRERIYTKMRDMGFRFPQLIHPTAWVASSVILDEGVQIMAGTIIQPDCHIGENTIINTRASIDHDCVIAENVHIAPGATLCGGVRVNSGVFVGSGAVLIQGLQVGSFAVVGAGVTLTQDIQSGLAVTGSLNRVNDKWASKGTR
jgi:UDP-perosamine 4-acetyltransferase